MLLDWINELKFANKSQRFKQINSYLSSAFIIKIEP
jgi:hypothetical protein